MAKIESELQNTFILIVGGLKRAMSRTMQDMDLPLAPMDFIILKSISNNSDCTSLTLVELTRKDKGQITRLVAKLIGLELVEKHANEHDKRSHFLRLTGKGSECLAVLNETDQKSLKQMRVGVSDEELALFIDIGKRMSGDF